MHTPVGDDGPLPTVSVIVPHYADLAGLGGCLSALGAQSLPADRFEIIVGDNNSPDGEAAVAAVIAGRARLTIIREPGAGAARNGAVALARGPILAFTDSDCVPDRHWLEQGVAALKGCDIVGGRMNVLVRDPRSMTGAETFERVFAFNNKAYVEKHSFTVSANLFCARDVFQRVGGFLPAGISEDKEWCLRARSQGFSLCYAPDSQVGHPARRSWSELLRKWRRINAELFHLAIMARGGRLIWLLRTLALPFSAVAHTPRVLFGSCGATSGQRLKALVILYRLRGWRFFNSLRLLAGAS